MSWNELAAFLLNTVGATDAIALDGGGSTTTWINGQGVVNVPSDGSERAVANAVMLGLGRFVFLPYQRDRVSSAGLPEQNGQTHLAAGDRLAEEASFLMTTNDPAGFNLIDVMAWGALGHALGFAVLAANPTAIPLQ